MVKTVIKDTVPAYFSGHETFPLRQMWLKKAFDQSRANWRIPKSTFTDEAAIAEFGVGKNMVTSIKHWALACDLMRLSADGSGDYVVTECAREIFDDEGFDPYSENPRRLGSPIGASRESVVGRRLGIGFSITSACRLSPVTNLKGHSPISLSTSIRKRSGSPLPRSPATSRRACAVTLRGRPAARPRTSPSRCLGSSA